jgi:hypothetical protein
MKKHFYLSVAVLLLHHMGQHANAQQTSFPTKEFIDVNNIRASALLHGDLWSNHLGGIQPACEFPKGSGKHVMMSGALWMAGFSNSGKMHVSAQTYRMSGNDYWPGPLNSSGSTTLNIINQWAKIWKINKSDIDNFLALTNRNANNVPKVILEWPAKDNPHAKGNGNMSIQIDRDMAPFVDVNKDGKYNALDGDHPAMKGDQMLWWVFNDNGITHDHSTNGGLPLKVEIKATAFAFKRNTLADNIIFYEYEITNKSSNNYSDFRLGLWVDSDLGYAFDDYIGFDSSHRMGIAYNGTVADGTGQPESYGSQIPTAGVTLIKMPGDNLTSRVPAGSFVYYNNGSSIIGDPTTDSNYNNYMRSILRNGDSFRNDFTGKGNISKGFGSGPATHYIFPGDPSDTMQWSECVSNNYWGDRRFIITTDDFSFNSGATEKMVFALVVTDPVSGYNCSNDFSAIRKVADSAWQIHKDLPPVSVRQQTPASSKLKIYPSPAKDLLYIETATVDPTMETIRVYDNLGKVAAVNNTYQNGKWQLDVSLLPAGVYHIRYQNGGEQYHTRFIKE